MQTKDRKLLARLATALLVIWFIGDMLLGAAVGSMQIAAKNDPSHRARAEANRRNSGVYSSYRGQNADSGLLDLSGLHETLRLPLRFAAAVGLLLFLAFGPVVQWARNLPDHFVQKPRLVAGMILIAVAVAIFAGAQLLASSHSTTFT